jgi:hypothetical protein
MQCYQYNSMRVAACKYCNAKFPEPVENLSVKDKIKRFLKV